MPARVWRETVFMKTATARSALDEWRRAFPADPFADDTSLQAILNCHLTGDRLEALRASSGAFAREVVTVVGPAASRYEQRAHLPELARWDGLGRRMEEVSFDPSYHQAGRAVWRSGLVALSAEPGRAYEQAVLLYLLSLEGEAGHACPATCTIGLARALRRVADDDVRERFLPALVGLDYDVAERGSQFLTEVQGGSDVGANVCEAVPTGDGRTWRVTGEKWFCSVADARQFFLTARVQGGPPGTRGLGSFLVPRLVDGEPNGFSLRRLKDKLGTRGMASGEIDFDGALGWPVGPVADGFKTAVGIVLNTSRWMTTLGDAGMMRRAVLEARAYARHREAFGQPIEDFPAVRRRIVDMATSQIAALHLCFELTRLEDLIDSGQAKETDVVLHRFCVNVAKYLVSLQATEVVHFAIEVLGGNGAIEDFSVLPRLYRDAIVYESWEGTHNVLVAQVLNDCRRLPILDVVGDRLDSLTSGAGQLGAEIARITAHSLNGAWRAVGDLEFGAWHFRDLVDRIGVAYEAALLASSGETEHATHLMQQRNLALSGTDDVDAALPGRVDAIWKQLG
jgi:alkylation response protein AidB-like acyl-CoA dehydrogenase